MKKRLVVLCLGFLALFLWSGCASQTLSLEDHTWIMTTVFDQDGNVVACAPGQANFYPEAQEVVLSLQAKSGALELKREDTGETATGTYRQTEKNPDGRLYELEIQGLGQGFGGCAFTNYQTGEQTPTFAVQFPETYSLYFTAAAE